MSKQHMNLQDSYLNQVRRENAEVQVLLVTGTSLSGFVKGFDNFTVILNERNGHQHLVYKHAIAHVTSQKPLSGRPHHGESAGEQEPKPARDAAREPSESRERKKKSGFNPIDLSGVKLDADTAETEKVVTNK